VRNKELEQSRVPGYPQDHEDRCSSYVLNTLLGGSMSSRLFQNVGKTRAGLCGLQRAGRLPRYRR
jgi:predicted Zn-dependent peptidase